MNKTHDWFATSLFQPDLTIDDFYNLGITPNNTGMKSKDDYKNIPEVIQAFTDNTGRFKEFEFNQFYDNALLSYNDYSKAEFDKKVLENYEWDPNDWMSPLGAKQKDVSAKFVLGQKNPMKISSGIEALGINSSLEFSNRELAQANEVRDQYGNKLGYTPNEKGGLFKSLFRPILVLAQYDEDTVEEVEGRKIVHKKGELKLDEWGTPYYEELGDREMYGRDVLHYSDTFTVDGSKWNKYDFFDSDGIDKSVGGTIAKTVFKIAPYFIPYVREVWGAANASMEIAQLLPTLTKAVTGVFTNSQDSDSYKSLNKWESALERFDGSTSDYARNKMVTVEGLGNLIADISGQLWQQRAIGSIPMYLEKLGVLEDASKYTEVGKNMALTYMASTSTKETYGSFIEAGANPTTAGLAMIGNIVALNKLMNIEYFRKGFLRGSWFDDDCIRFPAYNVAKQLKNSISEINETVASQKGAKAFLGSVTNLFSENLIPGFTKSEFVRSSVAEGVEEMMEEVVFDLSKAFTEGLNAIGLTVTRSNEDLNFDWTLKDIAARYAMSFGGGIIGGALFQGQYALENWGVTNAVANMDSNDMAKLTYAIAQGRGGEIRKYYAKLHAKGQLGDPNLSGTKLRTTVNLHGIEESIAEGAELGKSQNDIVYDGLLRHIDYIENVLKSERFAYPEQMHAIMALHGIKPQKEEHMLKAQILNISLTNSNFFNELNTLATEVVKTRAQLESRYNELVKGETDKEKAESVDIFKKDERTKELTEKLKNLRDRRDQILNGELNWYYVIQGLFTLDEDTNRWFFNMDLDKFAQLTHGKRYSDMSEFEKEEVNAEHQVYMNTEGRGNVYRAFDVYLKLSELAGSDLDIAVENLKGAVNESVGGKKSYYELAIEKQQSFNEAVEEYNNLVRKEVESGLTDEEFQTKEALLKKKEQLNYELDILSKSPSLMLQASTDVDEKMKYYWNNDIFQDETLEDGTVVTKAEKELLNTAELTQYLLSLYNGYISSKQVVRSEDELIGYYNLVKTLSNNKRPIHERMVIFMTNLEYWADDNGLDIDSLLELNLDSSDPLLAITNELFNKQRALARIISEMEDAVGINPNLVNQKLQEAREFIKNNLPANALNDAQIDSLIKQISYQLAEGQSFFDVYQQLETLRGRVKRTPIFDILQKLQATYSTGTLDLSQVLNEEVYSLLTANRVEDYIISSKQVTDELKQVAEILYKLKAIINGSQSGLNHTGNLLRKEQGISLLPELDTITAQLLNNDIDFILKKINLLLNIAANNNNKKLKMHKDTEMKMKPMAISYLLDDNFVKAFKMKFADVDIEELWKKANVNGIRLDSIKDDNWVEFESTRIRFESALQKEIIAKYPDLNIAADLVSLFGDNLFKTVSTKIDPETTEFTGYDMLLYLADIVSLDGEAFAHRYNEVIQKSKDLVPVYGQELAIRRNVSMIANPQLFGNIASEIRILHPDKDSKKTLGRTSLTLGGAGTGKTVAVSAISAAIMAFDDDVEFVFLAPTEKQAKNLENSVIKTAQQLGRPGVNISSTTITEDSLKDYFGKIKFTKKDGNLSWNTPPLTGKNLWKTDKKRKILIVDEVTLFDGSQLQALSHIALRENGHIWALGDDKQNAATVTMEWTDEHGRKQVDHNQHSGIEDFITIKSPSLTTALRPSTVGKFDNALTLDRLLTTINERAVENNAVTLADYNRITTEVASEVRLKYYENPETHEVYGERFIGDSEDTVSIYLTALAKIGKSVAYITDKDKTVPDGIEVINIKKDPKKAQGGEWDYVIVDKKWNTEDKYDTMRDFYTLSQRSTTGTIIINREGVKDTLHVVEDNTPTAMEKMSISDKDKQEFVDWKKAALSTQTVVSNDFSAAFVNTPTATPHAEEVTTSNNEVIETPQEKGLVPIKGSKNSADTSEETVEVAQQESDSDSQFVFPQSEIVESGFVTDNPHDESEKPKIWSSVGGESETRIEEKPEVVGLNSVPTDEISYFSTIMFDRDLLYWNDVIKQAGKESIWHGLTSTEARDFANMLAGAIKMGIDFNKFEVKLVVDSVIKDPDKRTRVKSILSDILNSKLSSERSFTMEFIPYGEGDSLLVANFIKYGNRETSFDIPLTYVKGHSWTGEYTGSFKLAQKPQYQAVSEIALDGKEHASKAPLTRLQEDYPWLIPFKTMEVLSTDPATERNLAGHDASTQNYVRNGNGKVNVIVTDNPYLALVGDSDKAYSVVQVSSISGEDFEYTYIYPKECAHINVQRPVSLSDVIVYSMQYARRKEVQRKSGGINKSCWGKLPVFNKELSWMIEQIGAQQLPSPTDYKIYDKGRFQIITDSSRDTLIGKMINKAAVGTKPVLKRLIEFSISRALAHSDFNNDYRGYQWLSVRANKNGEIVEYRIRYDKSDDNYHIEKQETSSRGSITWVDGEILEPNRSSGYNLFNTTDLLSKLGANIEFGNFGYNYFKNGVKKEGARSTSEQIAFLFCGIEEACSESVDTLLKMLDEELKTDSNFVNGVIFANTAGGNFMPNNVSRRAIDSNRSNYITSALNWSPSQYYLSSNDRVSEAKKSELDKYQDIIDRIRGLVNFIDISSIESITPINPADIYESINQFVTGINALLKNSSKDWNYKQLVINGDSIELVDVGDLNGWISAKTGESGDINWELNLLDTSKFGIFSLPLSNKIYYMEHNGTQWNVTAFEKFDSFGTFKPLLDFWVNSKTELLPFLPNFDEFLKGTLENSNAYAEEISDIFYRNMTNPVVENSLITQLQTLVNRYLENRIETEEC